MGVSLQREIAEPRLQPWIARDLSSCTTQGYPENRSALEHGPDTARF